MVKFKFTDCNDRFKSILTKKLAKRIMFNKFQGIFLVLIIILLFIVFKFNYLNLPFYWDEAWSYATAIFDMHNKGSAILTGYVNSELTRGHPLVFYYTAVLWLKVFGSSLFSCHAFPLIISCFTLITLYKLCIDLFNFSTAIIAVLFLSVQSYFLAQSTLLLPEIFLTLFTLLSINAYFRKRWWWFALFSSIVVMTKETGLVLIASFLFDKIILSRIIHCEERKLDKNTVKEILFLLVPVFVFAIFLIIQKIRFGWFFFPEHMGMIKIEAKHNFYCFKEYSKLLFYQNGRILLLLLIAGSSLYLFFKKKYESKEIHYILFFSFFILFYLLFSSINYFTNRYLLSILPLYLLIGSFFIVKITGERKIVTGIISICFMALFCYKTIFTYWDESDTSLGLIDTVKLHKEVVNYCEKNGWQDKKIFTGFLMTYDLKNPQLGYLNNKSNPFKRVFNIKEEGYEFFIFYSNEYDHDVESIRCNNEYILLKRFEKGKAWAEVYKKITIVR
jgi:4-amino-4-deoxy-L-arabinose transferase-like glycosyltransferase